MVRLGLFENLVSVGHTVLIFLSQPVPSLAASEARRLLGAFIRIPWRPAFSHLVKSNYSGDEVGFQPAPAHSP